MPEPAPLISNDDLIAYLQRADVSNTSSTTLYDALRNTMSEHVRTYCADTFAALGPVTDLALDRLGGGWYGGNTPIASVVSAELVTLGAAGGSKTVNPADVILCSFTSSGKAHSVRLINTTDQPNTILRVSGTAGWDQIPSPVKMATCIACAHHINRQTGWASDEYSQSVAPATHALPLASMQLLQPYRRIVV